MNKVCITGRIVNDLELKETQNGKKFCKITVAVRRNSEVSDFVDCTAWEKQAEFLSKYFEKGKPISVIGEIHTNLFEKDRKKSKYIDVRVTDLEFVPQDKTEKADKDEGFTEIDDEDLPFV